MNGSWRSARSADGAGGAARALAGRLAMNLGTRAAGTRTAHAGASRGARLATGEVLLRPRGDGAAAVAGLGVPRRQGDLPDAPPKARADWLAWGPTSRESSATSEPPRNDWPARAGGAGHVWVCVEHQSSLSGRIATPTLWPLSARRWRSGRGTARRCSTRGICCNCSSATSEAIALLRRGGKPHPERAGDDAACGAGDRARRV